MWKLGLSSFFGSKSWSTYFENVASLESVNSRFADSLIKALHTVNVAVGFPVSVVIKEWHNPNGEQARTMEMPYGTYKYESAKNYLPGGLFHFVKDTDSYMPTLHGLNAGSRIHLKEVTVYKVTSSIAKRPFLNNPNLYEVKLINTRHQSLRAGDVDNMTVNKGIWGGLLATRRVN
ncbi:hypothetical protein PAMP_006427 [Pampus punctatissimus]